LLDMVLLLVWSMLKKWGYMIFYGKELNEYEEN
jgi:uncharacterized protein YqgQ